MPYRFSRMARSVVARPRVDGSVELRYIDEISPRDAIDCAASREVAEILSYTHEFDHLINDDMTPMEKLRIINRAPWSDQLKASYTIKNDDADSIERNFTMDPQYWHWIQMVARQHGWVPAGTDAPLCLSPETWPQWDGSYNTIFGQTIRREDVASMVEALRVAFLVDQLPILSTADLDFAPKDLLLQFVDFCNGDYSLSIW